MRASKTLPVLSLLILLFFSCQNDLKESVVFFSEDKLVEVLSVQIQNTEGNVIPVKSCTVVSLKKSEIFSEHIQYLTDVDVTEMSVKVKKLNNSSSLDSKSNQTTKFKIFLDEIDITSKIGITSLQAKSNDNLEFKITDALLLSTISSKLLQNKEIVISYDSTVESNSQLDFKLEFSLTANGTFVD